MIKERKLIRVWNPGAERIFGHRADEAMGQSLDLIIPERLRARHWEGFRRVMTIGESHYGEGDLLSVQGLLRMAGALAGVHHRAAPGRARTDAGSRRGDARRDKSL